METPGLIPCQMLKRKTPIKTRSLILSLTKDAAATTEIQSLILSLTKDAAAYRPENRAAGPK